MIGSRGQFTTANCGKSQDLPDCSHSVADRFRPASDLGPWKMQGRRYLGAKLPQMA